MFFIVLFHVSFCPLPPKPTNDHQCPKPGPVDLTSSSSFSQRLAGRPKRFVKASSKVSTSKAKHLAVGEGAAGWDGSPEKRTLIP